MSIIQEGETVIDKNLKRALPKEGAAWTILYGLFVEITEKYMEAPLGQEEAALDAFRLAVAMTLNADGKWWQNTSERERLAGRTTRGFLETRNPDLLLDYIRAEIATLTESAGPLPTIGAFKNLEESLK